MASSNEVPNWLWRTVTVGFFAVLAGVGALAIALSLGAADPPRAGPLAWDEIFQGDVSRWELGASEGASIQVRGGALVAEFTAPGQTAWAITAAPTGSYTLEIAAAQAQGEIGAEYGVVFDWRSEAEHAAVLINGNGYAEAFRQTGGGQAAWFPFQQWPHILYGAEANRVRVDVAGERVSARINDELLFETADLRGFENPEGLKLGVFARAEGAGQVVFGWVKVWVEEK
ncbi:MAG: hypothetical protein JNL09_01045 [Anaerolineales bacterium]|nr:hypothetical protein [Anaerolineales bacterium]